MFFLIMCDKKSKNFNKKIEFTYASDTLNYYFSNFLSSLNDSNSIEIYGIQEVFKKTFSSNNKLFYHFSSKNDIGSISVR